MNRKRLTTAFFLYGFLEYTGRSGIAHEFKPGENWLEDSILEYYNVAKSQFSSHWTSKHFCNGQVEARILFLTSFEGW